MKSLKLCALAIAASAVCATGQTFAVRNVRVFDGESVTTDATVIVADGKSRLRASEYLFPRARK